MTGKPREQTWHGAGVRGLGGEEAKAERPSLGADDPKRARLRQPIAFCRPDWGSYA